MTGNGHAHRRVTHLASAELPTKHGRFTVEALEVEGAPVEFIAIAKGDYSGGEPPLVRLHSECLTGDALGSLRCDCGEQLAAALELISEEGRGLVLYLRQEGRGIGLANKIKAYALQDSGMDTVDANVALGLPVDGREYATAAAILLHLGVPRVRLLTNNPEKCRALEAHGIKVKERIALAIPPNPSNLDYLHTKARRMGHLIDFRESVEKDHRTA
jgi:GTP cyclohydrolase II